MVARMSPLFELSDAALSMVMIIGAVTAFTMGLIGIVQNDIKRVIAYSTLSQLGYMTVALGASAYSAAIFHLMTHAFFKALLFLAAGSIIIVMHHQQDLRQMGGLRKYMPVTWLTAWIGTLALVGFPFFSGFYSKDIIIEAVHASSRFGSTLAYWSVLLGVFVTAIYSFRLLHLAFHGEPRMDDKSRDHLHEAPLVVTVPLVLLAIPSVLVGYFTVGPVLFGGWLTDSIYVKQTKDVLAEVGSHFNGPFAMAMHAVQSAPFWLMASGFAIATIIYLFRPATAGQVQQKFPWLYRLLDNKYYIDEVYRKLFAEGGIRFGTSLWRRADAGLIDGIMVNGSAHLVNRVAALARRLQTGYLYHYAFAMIIGLIGIIAYWVIFRQG